MTPAALRDLATTLRSRPSGGFVDRFGIQPRIEFTPADRDAVCDALTAAADRIERLELELASAENALREAGER